MTLYVYNAEIKPIGLVESITSLQWLSKYQDAGEVKLVCSPTEANISKLIDGNRLYCTEHEESAIIRNVEISDTGKTAQMTIRAVFSVGRWSDRVVMATENISNAEAGMLMLTHKHRRGLPGTTGSTKGLTQVIETQITWNSILDAQKELATTAGLGFREKFIPTSGIEVFDVYEGVNRTYGDNYNGYFGDDIGNISNLKITKGTNDWKNFAIVGGHGEGDERKVITFSIGEHTGDDRRELWVDANDISQTYQVAISDGSGGYTYEEAIYTDSEYKEMLYARGLEKLAEKLKTLEINATLEQRVMHYGIDYFLGDIVPIKLTKYGLNLSARIASIRTIYESTGKTINAVLSDFNLNEEVYI